MNIDNTASSWYEFLTSLSMEAQRDADATDKKLALHGVLSDLANVTLAYAGRLEVERGKNLSRPGDGAEPQLVTEPVSGVAIAAEPVSPSEDSARSAETFEAGGRLPGWLIDALADMERRLAHLEGRVLELEQRPRDYVAVTDPYQISAASIIDEDRSAWNSVDRARAALRGMIMREHARMSASRQAILSRLASLALDPDKDGLVAAELRQHRDRAKELADIDAIMGVKLDEIAAIDDLLALREYDPLKGWPG